MQGGSTFLSLGSRYRAARPARCTALWLLLGLGLAGCGDATRRAGADRRTAAAPPSGAAEVARAAGELPERLRFAYRISGRPAAGLVASFTPGGGGAGPSAAGAAVLDTGGGLRAPERDGGLRLIDPVSGLVLFEAGSLDALRAAVVADASGVIRLPMPVRVVGRLAGFAGRPEAAEVHHGTGPRIAVTDYVRREQGLLLRPDPDENRAWGLELPAIASRWGVARLRPDGSFDTGWLPLVAAPQLIAAAHSGQLATLEVPLPPGLGAHALLDAGAIAPQPSAAVEIDRTGLRPTDLPLVLEAGLDAAEVPAADRAQAALRLALLHRIDPRAANFATRRRPVAVELEGVTRVGGLPPFARLELHVAGPRPGLLLRRTLALPPGGAASASRATRVSLSAAELLGAPRRIPLTGRVRFADGRPAAGATVVYSSYPDRREIRADAAGAFAIPAVAAGRQAVIFVDAPAGGRPPFERVTAAQRLELAPDQQRVAVQITVPLPPADAAIVRCPFGQPSDVTTAIPYRMPACGDRITQSQQLAYCPILGAYRLSKSAQEVSPVEVGEIQVNSDGGAALAKLRVPAVGEYIFMLSYTPFLYAQTQQVIDTLDPVTVPFTPPEPWGTSIIVAVDQVGRPASKLEIAFPNWVPAADPFNGLTDQNGAMEVSCFNLDPVPGFVASDHGCFEGPVRLRERSANVQLGSCDGF